MRKILLTGMSGTGKSAALAELEKRGFAIVDTDYGAGVSGRIPTAATCGARIASPSFWQANRGRRSTSRARSRTRGSSTRSSTPWSFSALRPKSSFAVSPGEQRTTTGRAGKIATSSCATRWRSNRCSAQLVRTRLTRRSPSMRWFGTLVAIGKAAATFQSDGSRRRGRGVGPRLDQTKRSGCDEVVCATSGSAHSVPDLQSRVS
jgi:hypothetical protein